MKDIAIVENWPKNILFTEELRDKIFAEYLKIGHALTKDDVLRLTTKGGV